MDNSINQINSNEITLDWLKINKPEIIIQLQNEIPKKYFFRPSNLWRIAGMFIAILGIYVKTIIIYDINNESQITSNTAFILTGLLIVLVPSLKDFFPYLTNLVNAIRGIKTDSISKTDGASE